MTENEKLDLILSEMQDMKADGKSLNERMSSLNERMSSLNEQIASLNERMANVESDVRDTRLILENEIRVNIRRVAEGHLDLSRNLHEALKIDSEKEMLAIRVSVLESDVRRIKEQLETA